MKHRTNILQKLTAGTFILLSVATVSAFDSTIAPPNFNGVIVSAITDTSAQFSLSPGVLAQITDEEKSGLSFSYEETKKQVCIDIYPTPAACLPTKTAVGKGVVTVTGLKPATSYTVTYGHDNTIRCITAPCPTNAFMSVSSQFTTKVNPRNVLPLPSVSTPITKNLYLGSHGKDVVTLQTFLIKEGYFKSFATGYYGFVTFQAVKKFQSDHNLATVGYVGTLTRALINKMLSNTVEESTDVTFEGTVTAYSTACFSDGICSITVDGKKVVTTIGWSQQIVGTVRGISDFGAISSNIGSHAKVYAQKTDDGYTLYGNANYYVEITPSIRRKIIDDRSIPSGDVSSF